MKRMVDEKTFDTLKKLAKEIVYNEESNTIEVGGNLYVDGNFTPHLLKLQDGTLAFYQLYDDMIVFYAYGGDGADNSTISHHYGIGYIEYGEQDETYVYGIAYRYIDDAIGSIEIYSASDNRILITFNQAILQGNEVRYFEHQLKVTTAADTFVYLSYPSKNNLVIDSLQDLTTVVKPNANTRLGFGNGYLYYENNIWKSSTTNAAITAVEDNVVVID